MPDRARRRRALFAAALAGVGAAAFVPRGAVAQDGRVLLRDAPVPPAVAPTPGRVAGRGGHPSHSPVTGASGVAGVLAEEPPPSLEVLMAARPGTDPEAKLPPERATVLRDAGVAYGAAGGLAARAHAINRMLYARERELDATYDFAPLLLRVGATTMLQPPIVTEAQMAGALDPGGQVARETGRIFRITREARLVSGTPNWRTYLVQEVHKPVPPQDEFRPKDREEVAYWNRTVAQGWALGEAQAVDIFRAQLGQLQQDFIGMARYHVLLRARLVEAPTAALAHVRARGGGDVLRVDDTSIRLRQGGGLVADPRRWRPGQLPPGGMAPAP